MKLGVMTVLLGAKPAEEAFRYLSSLKVQTVEIGTGGFPGTAHLKPKEFLSDSGAAASYREMLKRYNLEISALSAHSNHVHPQKEIASKAHEDFINTCRVAQALNVDTVVTFSGCPGDHPGAKYSNWVTCSWPEDFQKILEYQWNDALIPYWQSAVKEAANYGVTRIAIEMHPGFCVYNPQTLLKLRKAAGDAIGANFDPSHLFWQGIKPSQAVKALKGAIYHFHAKDTKIDEANVRVNGILDTGNYANVLDRSWVFRTVGYGHDYLEWKDIISTLAATGYDRSISIEHEDMLMSVNEGLEKAVSFLRETLIFDKV